MGIQQELKLDHEPSLDHWARLLANQEVGGDVESYEWDYYYESYWDKLESGEDYDLLTPWEVKDVDLQ
jgi:hypothetical protein